MILGIDTSTAVINIGLIDNEKVIFDYTCKRKEPHCEELLLLLHENLKLHAVDIKQVKGVGISIGPGSFTGLRTGLAFAKGLAVGLEVPLIGVPTLDAVVTTLIFEKNLESKENTLIIPVILAVRGEFYYAVYRGEKLLTDYMADLPKDIAKTLEKFHAKKIIITGNALDYLKENSELDSCEFYNIYFPKGSIIAKLAGKNLINKRFNPKEIATLEPIYIHPPRIKQSKKFKIVN